MTNSPDYNLGYLKGYDDGRTVNNPNASPKDQQDAEQRLMQQLLIYFALQDAKKGTTPAKMNKEVTKGK